MWYGVVYALCYGVLCYTKYSPQQRAAQRQRRAVGRGAELQGRPAVPNKKNKYK